MVHLHSLFLKPSFACTAKCDHCASRRSFYGKRGDPSLTITAYKSIIREAKSLGASSLHISGGEPTLYPNLTDLVYEASRLDMFTVLNTNGSLITPKIAEELLKAGLRSVIISIHSHEKHKHDSIRRREGNFDEVTKAIEILRKLRDTLYPDFLISSQTILTKSNYKDLAGIIDLACALMVDAHGISYLEGDFDLKQTLDVEDIAVLRNEVIPEVVSRLKSFSFKNVLLKYAAIKLVSRLYNGSRRRQNQRGQGIYLEKSEYGNCRTPRGFVMVLADGSVLPCNMVEYTDGPILGNVYNHKLYEILTSSGWREFAKHGYEYCRYCPTHLHFHIPIATSLRKVLPLIVKNPAYEQKSVSRRIKEAM